MDCYYSYLQSKQRFSDLPDRLTAHTSYAPVDPIFVHFNNGNATQVSDQGIRREQYLVRMTP